MAMYHLKRESGMAKHDWAFPDFESCVLRKLFNTWRSGMAGGGKLDAPATAAADANVLNDTVLVC